MILQDAPYRVARHGDIANITNISTVFNTNAKISVTENKELHWCYAASSVTPVITEVKLERAAA